MATADQTAALAFLNGAFGILTPCLKGCFVSAGISSPVTWNMVYDSCNIPAKKDAIDTCIPACHDSLGGLALEKATEACKAFTPAFSPGAVQPTTAAQTTGAAASTTGAAATTDSAAAATTTSAAAPAESTTASDAAATSDAAAATDKPGYEAPAATKPAPATNLYSSASAVVGSIAAVFAAAALC
ncbi:hypothetical protein HDU81_010058 [Chytriomyces hyalinus]|nr:hypothetical protein HDU81_010058 [Chytriomyces hyalinus]